jgi:hypothetical protein
MSNTVQIPAFPPLAEITGYLASVRTELATVIATTPHAAFDRAPAGENWSGTQIIQHLGIVEGMAGKLLEGLFAKAVADGIGEAKGSASWLDSLDRFNILDRSIRIEAPARAIPPAASELAPSWESLQGARQRVLRAVAAVDGRDLTQVSAPHPLFGPLNGYEWILVIGKHEARHLAQLRETLA